jgi:tetratricopeptide (TPR) repeat protein
MTLGQDDKYDKIYWEIVVPRMGNCHVNLKAYPEAAVWFRRSYQHNIAKDELSDVTEEMTCKLLGAYREQNDAQQAFEIIRTLDARLKDGKSWLARMLENPCSDLHEHLILLAHDNESYTIVDTYYERTIKGTDEKAEKSGARHFLEYTKGRLHFYCGPSDTRKLLLSRWEAIANHLREHDSLWGWWTRRALVREYTKLWVSLSLQSVIEEHEQQELTDKLNKLSEINNDLNTYSVYCEAKLALARVLSKDGKFEEAREVLRPLVKKAVEQARTVDESEDGYERLALILPVINDDVNALAAWSTLSPLRLKDEDSLEQGDASYTSESNTSGSPEPAAITGVPANSYSADEDDSQDEPAEDEKHREDLVGNIGFSCDGRCGRDWDYADDIWVCRDCLCVQLDTGCFEKLKRGELPVTICHPEHDYLHVPPFDLHAWKAMESTTLRVGSEIVSRDAWLTMLEKEWSIKK